MRAARRNVRFSRVTFGFAGKRIRFAASQLRLPFVRAGSSSIIIDFAA